jgi:hypothetical protein
MLKSDADIRTILNSPPDLLTSLQRQRRFLALQYQQPQPCPNCKTLQNVYEASRIPIEQFDFTASGTPPCFCTACGRQLEFVVPFIAVGGGPNWHWSLVPVKPEAVAALS